jgi:hypothetical protein
MLGDAWDLGPMARRQHRHYALDGDERPIALTSTCLAASRQDAEAHVMDELLTGLAEPSRWEREQ